MRGRVAGAIFVAILVVFEVNCNDVKQFSASKLTELVEVKTTDDQGNVKARVVARSVPSNNDDSEGAGADDEDSKSTSEGSGDTNSDHFQTAVFNDQPMNVFDNGSSTASVISPSPSPSTAAKQTSSTMTNVAATKIRSSPSSNSTIASTKSTPRSSIKSPTSSESIAIEPARTITSTQVSSSTSVTESPTSMSTEVTTQPKTTVKATTGEPSTTSDEIPTSQLNVNKPTTESSSIIINGTGEPVVVTKNTSKNSTVSTEVKISTVKPTTKSTISSVNVHAQQDPTEKPRKTLFGFVTVEILIALLAGALFSILLVAFLVYRLKKRNEGSYELSETIALRPKELDEMGTNKEVFV